MTVFDIAWKLNEAGISCIPIKANGSKAPDVSAWEPYGRSLPTQKELESWFVKKNSGIAIIGGEVSGNLGVIDIEFEEYYELFSDICESEVPGVLGTLPRILTPGKRNRGTHFYFRADCKIKTQKLALLPPIVAAEWNGKETQNTAIEIKAEGGYVLTAGCPAACHPTGRLYEHVSGPAIWDVPTITTEQASKLIACAKALTYRGEVVKDYSGRQYRSTADSPGSEFNRRGPSIREQIEAVGWTLTHKIGDVEYWRRPDKKDGWSATLGYGRSAEGDPLFHVFTTSTEFQDRKSYDAFGVYAVLRHNGDFAKAAQALRAEGYGKPDKPGTPSIASLIGVEPIPPSSGDAPMEFPIVALPTKLGEYVRTVSESLACPLDFPATAILGAASVAIGTTRALRVKQSWAESPRIYLAIIAEPGSAKTPAQNAVMRPVLQKQADLYAEYLKAKKDFAAGTETDGKPPEKPHYKHLLTTDATIEALAKILQYNRRGIIYYADEITGWARSMGQYKAGKGNDRQFWLKAWSGEQHSVDRVKDGGEPAFIESPFITVLGGIQPDMMSELSDPNGRQDGFLHRLLFSFPESRPMALWTEASPDEHASEVWGEVVKNLFKCMADKIRVPGTHDSYKYVPRPLELTPAGKELFVAWYDVHIQETWEEGFPPSLMGPWSKFRSYAIRLILIAHMLQVACLETDRESHVEDEAVARGLMLVEYFKAHARRVYANLSKDPKNKKLEEIFTWVKNKRGGITTPKDLVRIGHFADNAEQALAYIESLVRLGWGTKEVAKMANGKDRVTFKAATFEEWKE